MPTSLWPLKTEGCHDSKFAVINGTNGCQNGKLCRHCFRWWLGVVLQPTSHYLNQYWQSFETSFPTSHYVNQCWQSLETPFGMTVGQWAKIIPFKPMVVRQIYAVQYFRMRFHCRVIWMIGSNLPSYPFNFLDDRIKPTFLSTPLPHNFFVTKIITKIIPLNVKLSHVRIDI